MCWHCCPRANGLHICSTMVQRKGIETQKNVTSQSDDDGSIVLATCLCGNLHRHAALVALCLRDGCCAICHALPPVSCAHGTLGRVK